MPLSEDQKAMLRLLAQREQGYGDIAALTGSDVEEVRAKVREALAGLDRGPSQDQKAMLRLLAQREEGYEDIGALMGLGVGEVRDRVRDALAELDPPAGAGKGPTKAPEPPPAPPPEPAAPTPAPPPAAEPEAPKPAARTTSRGAPKLRLPEDTGARRALIAGGAVVLVIVLLLVTGVLGGSDDGSSSATTTATTGGESSLENEGEGGTPAAGGKQPTQAVLSAVDGSEASGQAVFGRQGQKVVLLVAAKGMPAAPQGQSYTVSLVRSANERLPLVATKASKGGVVSGRFQIAPQVLGLLASGFDTMEVSLVPDGELKAALSQARTAKKAPNYGGTAILEGPITGPIVEAGEKEG